MKKKEKNKENGNLKALALTVILLLMISPVLSVTTIAGKCSGNTSSATMCVPSSRAYPMLPPDTQFPSPDHIYNHWWDIDYWDTYSPYGGSMPPYMTGEFIAVANTFEGLTEGSDFYNLVWYLPLNVAYGTSNTNCVWFQFAVKFVDPNPGSHGETVPSNMPDPVTWQIWDIKGPGSADSDYKYTTIGLAYVVGHIYEWSLTASAGPTITFFIADRTAGTNWVINSWHWTIPSTNMLADESMFSPSSAIEGYTEPSTGLSGTPFFQSRIGANIVVDRFVKDVHEPSGITTYRLEIGDYETWNWMMLSPGALPMPVFSPPPSYPAIVHLGDTVTVEVDVTNDGGTSSWQTIDLSFPVGESVSNVQIEASDLSSLTISNPGDIVSAHYQLSWVTLSNYVVEAMGGDWPKFASHYLNVSFKPTSNGYFTFYTKSVAAGGDSRATIWSPLAGTKDEQGEYVWSFIVIVDSIRPKTTLTIGSPKYTVGPNVYVTSSTPFTLTAEDNAEGSGVKATAYRIYNASYNTGWLPYTVPFYLTGLKDGAYNIAYNSTDFADNVEATKTTAVILDNTPPTTVLTIGNPKYTDGSGNLYVASWTPFTLSATDGGSGVATTSYRIRNATYNSGWLTYTAPFTLTGLSKDTYSIDYGSTDNLGNAEPSHTKIVILNSKAAMIGYLKDEIQALINQVHGSAISPFFKNYLEINVLMCALRQASLAFDFTLAGDAAKANSALGACKDTMIGFKSTVMNLKAFGLIPMATANNWIATAQTIINDINTAIATPI